MSGDPKKFRFGDLIENGWASDDNPTKRGIFVRYYVKQGRMNAGPTVVLTDGKGKIWEQCGRADHKLTRIAEAQDIAALVAERDALRDEVASKEIELTSAAEAVIHWRGQAADLRDALEVAHGALLGINTPYSRGVADAIAPVLEPALSPSHVEGK